MSSTEFDESVVLNERSFANDDFVVKDQLFVQGATATDNLQVKQNMKVKGGLAVEGNTKLAGTPVAPDAIPTKDQHLATLKVVNDSVVTNNNTVVSFFSVLTDAINEYNTTIENGGTKEDSTLAGQVIIEQSTLTADMKVLVKAQYDALIKLVA